MKEPYNMELTENSGLSTNVEPILAVREVPAAVQYWYQTLGFQVKWTWGGPLNHGDVSWNGVAIQFSLNLELAPISIENAIFIS